MATTAEIRLTVTDEQGVGDANLSQKLRQDFDRYVAPTAAAMDQPVTGSKGDPATLFQFLVSIVATPATLSVISDILKTYLQQDHKISISLEGPGGKATLEASEKNDLDDALIAETLNRILPKRRD